MSLTIEQLLNEKKQDWALKLIAGKKGVKNKLVVSDVNRCGLALTGYFDYFPKERIQIIGKTEISYLKKLKKKKSIEILKKFFKYEMPVLVICGNISLPKEIIYYGNIKGIPIIKTSTPTTKFISKVTNFLEEKLASKITMHGVLMDIYGIGVLILGKSGIGKSECALELIKRGHRLVADDVVQIVKASGDRLVGFPKEFLRFFLEVRGLGIVNIKDLFGVGATRDRKRVEMVMFLEEWNERKYYERIGFKDKFVNIVGVKIPKIMIPVRPGRNITVIIEVAAMQERLKKMGYYSISEFENKVKKEMEKDKLERK
ncbi:MAG: HPr(Ser) kinase/phosphatase [Candidatus Firestonebacteria bacterium]